MQLVAQRREHQVMHEIQSHLPQMQQLKQIYQMCQTKINLQQPHRPVELNLVLLLHQGDHQHPELQEALLRHGVVSLQQHVPLLQEAQQEEHQRGAVQQLILTHRMEDCWTKWALK